MKRIIALVTAAALTACAVLPCFAVDNEDVSAPCAILTDSASGAVLYEKNADEQRSCASLTKIMTVLLVMEAIDSGRISYDDIVTVSERAASAKGADIWLVQGETMTVDDMLKAAVIANANDAAVTLAEFISGSEESFVSEMNSKAAALGMKNTAFKNCTGLEEEGHLTTARDTAVMSRELLRHKDVLKYTGTRLEMLRGDKTQIVSTNKLLKKYSGITGLMTDISSGAGACISASAERNGSSLIAVVLGAKSGDDRFTDAAALLDYGFDNYSVYTPPVPDDLPQELPVLSGMNDTIKLIVPEYEGIMIKKGSSERIKTQTELPESLTAPVRKDSKIGKLVFTCEGEKISEVPITAGSDVEKISFQMVFCMLLKKLLYIRVTAE